MRSKGDSSWPEIMLKAISSPTVIAGDDRAGTEIDDHRVGEHADILDGVLPEGGQLCGLERGADIGGEAVFPADLHHRFDGGGLDGLDADDGFDEELLAFGGAVEFVFDRLAQERTDQGGDEDVERDGGEDDQREGGGIGEQDSGEDEGEEHVDQREQALAGEEGADGFEFTDAGDGLAGGAGFEIGQRQAQEVMKQPRAEFDIEAIGGVGERVAAQILQCHIEEAEGGEADDDDGECGEAFVG